MFSLSLLQGKCGPGWDMNPSSDLCYMFAIELVSWEEAQSKCTDNGGSLLSILSDQEQSYIVGK